MKNHNGSSGPERNDPSPETIRRISAEIRAGWCDRERAKRAVIKERSWAVPRISQDVFGNANSTSESEAVGRD